MKRLFIAIVLLIITCSSIQAQDLVKKWNELYNRYEYYDSRGTLLGYEKWN